MFNSILKLFRKSDPETSQEAAEHAQEFIGNHEILILQVLAIFRNLGEIGGLTKNEIARGVKRMDNLDIDSVQVCRRMKKLEEDGKVVRTELKRKNANGHQETVWRLA